MEKEYKKYNIQLTRLDLSLKFPYLCVFDLTNKQMHKLVTNVANIMQTQYGYSIKEIKEYALDNYLKGSEKFNNILWREIEECMVTMGVRNMKQITIQESLKYLKKVEHKYKM